MASFSSAGIGDALDFEAGTRRAKVQLDDGRVAFVHPAVLENAATGINQVAIRCRQVTAQRQGLTIWGAVDAYSESLSMVVGDCLAFSGCRIAFAIQAYEADILASETSVYHLRACRRFLAAAGLYPIDVVAILHCDIKFEELGGRRGATHCCDNQGCKKRGSNELHGPCHWGISKAMEHVIPFGGSEPHAGEAGGQGICVLREVQPPERILQSKEPAVVRRSYDPGVKGS
jgi:hypothetical protein